MAQEKIDDREVQKIRASMTQDGDAKAAARFDENSPEFRKAQESRQKARAAGHNHRSRLQRAHGGQGQPSTPQTEGRARLMEIKKRQAAQNSRLRKRDAQSQDQGQGM